MPTASPVLGDSILKAHVTSLRLLFAAWICHFKSPGYIKESTLDILDKNVCKKTLERTVRDEKIRWLLTLRSREVIGRSRDVWSDLVEVFKAAVPSFEQRTFEPSPPVPPDYDGPSSQIIVTNSTTLLKDLQRLDHMLSIARNVLTIGETVQNISAQSHFDREVCALICLCIKITAKGYDGDSSPVDEDKWQGVINGFKKLLITSLQFLSNLVTMNERLKLMLWVELFDSSVSDLETTNTNMPTVDMPFDIMSASNWVMNATKAFMRSSEANITLPKYSSNELDGNFVERPLGPLPAHFAWLKENREQIKADLSTEKPADDRMVAKEANRRWTAMTEDEKAPWQAQHDETLAKFHHDLEAWQGRGGSLDPENMPAAAADYLAGMTLSDKPQVSEKAENNTLKLSANILKPQNQSTSDEVNQATVSEFRMIESAAEGAKKLLEGKTQLLKRLESYPSESPAKESLFDSPESPVVSPRSPLGTEPDLHSDKSDDRDSVEDDESSEEDFAVPGEDGRGLLTDIPLILGPNEIEVLPMIIMSGIVAPPDKETSTKTTVDKESPIINMHTIRCHLLLAQENGRNLLRELLIFVAAWDLREEELYFKFMVKIMEAILRNGLMPFAYGAFKESKDIISPAQAVIMKLLTKIFHSTQGNSLSRNALTPSSPHVAMPSSAPKHPLRSDVQIVHFLFNEFRQNIIPQICALIFLQGQIKAGKASPDDFPLNLWDMERMYEGVYQYLEFFAILTDHDFWKQMMSDWEVTSELVTLLRELESAIPKGRLTTAAMSTNNNGEIKGDMSLPTIESSTPPPVKPVAVERPFDLEPSANSPPSGDSELPNLEDSSSQFPEGAQDEPADFEWRNLKKLCVLVLSSLVWKNRKLQDQVRHFDGVMTILSCCAYDEHNPYIREHAIMCLRFLMEGNKENQDIIRSLDAQEAVPSEVLDQHGYETFMDSKGQVGLRRKEALNVNRFPTPSPGAGGSKLPSLPTGSLPEWMQMVMKSMPR